MKKTVTGMNMALAAALVCSLAVNVMLAVALATRPSPEQQELSIGTTTTQTQTTDATSAASADGRMVLIHTAYGSLAFPAEFEDHLHYTHTELDGKADIYTFLCVTEHGETELFKVCYNAPEVGEYIGFLRDGERDVPVTVAYPEQHLDEESVLERAMSEAVNDVIASLVGDERFTEA